MASPVIQFKRGLFSSLPGLRSGEPGFTTDKYDLYVGIDSTTNGNKFFGSHRYWTKETTTAGSGVNLVEGTNNGTNAVTLKAPANIASDVTYTFPGAAVDQGYLRTNSSGTLTWESGVNATGISTIAFLQATNVNTSGIVTASSFVGPLTGNSSTATTLQNSRNFSASGDATASAVSFNGSSNVDLALTLASSGVSAGTYGSQTQVPVVTVDTKGRVTSVTTAVVGTALTVTGDSGSEQINLLSEALSISGGTNLTSVASNNGVVINLDNDINLTTITASQVKATGIVTASSFSGSLANTLTLNTSGTGLSGSTTFNNSGAATFTVTSNATSANTVSTVVARDASGNFSAGTITAALTGNVTGNVSGSSGSCTGNAATVTTNANLTGDVTSVGNATAIAAGVIVDADINASAAISDTKLATIATAGKVSNSATTATSANTTSAIVARDASGNFSAGTVTAALTGNVTGNVTGNLNSTGVSTVTYLQNTNINSTGIHTAATFSGALANTLTLGTSGTGLSGSTTFNNSGAATFTVTSNATSANTVSTVVARDASGNFSAGTITANLTGTASSVTTNANLTGDVTSVGNATAIAAGVIVDADINASAGIVDTKLATISTAGKVSNSATTATSANTASAIVARDASGNFTAGTITAVGGLTGNVNASGVSTAAFLQATTVNASGIVTASQFSTGVSGTGINISVSGSTGTISGPSTLVIDPSGVGDNTGTVRIKGDFMVDGTQTIINSSVIDLGDFRIGIGTTAAGDVTLDGSGVGIGSIGYQKTFTWNNSSSALKSSENLDVASGKVYKVNGTEVLSGTNLAAGIGVSGTSLDIDGITAAASVVGTDLFIIDSGANGTNRKATAQQVSQYILGGSGGATLPALLVTGLSTFSGNVTASAGVSGNFNATGVSTAAFLQNTNINSTGIHTAATFSGSLANTLTLGTSGTGLSGSTTFNNSGAATFTVTSNATNANTVSTVVARDASGNFSAGTVTAALTGNVTGNINATGVSTAAYLQNTNINSTGIHTASSLRAADLRTTDGALIPLVGIQSAAAATGIVTAFKFVGTGLDGFTVANNVATISYSGVAATTYTSLQTVVATEGQTSFTFNAGYTEGFVDVYLNGIRLIAGTDYTANDGTAILLTSNATAGDELEIVAWKSLGEVVNVNTLRTAGSVNVSGVVTARSFNGALNFTGVSTAGQVLVTTVNATGIITASSFSGSGSGLSAGTVPISALDIDGGTAATAVTSDDLFIIDDGANGTNKKVTAQILSNYILGGSGGATFPAINVTGIGTVEQLKATTATVGAGLTVTGATNLNGGLNVSGGETVLSSATVSDLTSGRVVLAGTSGSLQDNANLTFGNDGLRVTGNENVSGIVTATGGFSGNVTGNVTGNLTGNVTGNINSSGVSTAAFLQVTTVNVSAAATIPTLSGTTATFTNITANGGLTGNLNATGVSTVTYLQNTNINSTGIHTASSFSGSGSGLSAGTVPASAIDIDGATAATELTSDDLFLIDDGAGGTNKKLTAQQLSNYVLGGSGGATFPAINVTGIATATFLKATTATVGAGLTVTGAITGNGGASITGGETTLSSATVSDLTSGRVVLAGTSGALVDSGNLTFGANGLVVTGGANVSAASTFSSNLAVGGNVIVSGDLTVNGTTTQINTVSMTVEDTLIELQIVDGSAPGSDTNKDVGIVMNYFDSSAKKAAFYWDDSASRMVAASQVSETTGVLTASTFAGLEIGSLWLNDCAGQQQVISCSGTTRSLNDITIDGGSF